MGPFIRIDILRRFRGVSPACPAPVSGRSASFRLRFRFVPCVQCVRAGEAKLCVRMYNVVLIAGAPGGEFLGVVLFSANLLCTGTLLLTVCLC